MRALSLLLIFLAWTAEAHLEKCSSDLNKEVTMQYNVFCLINPESQQIFSLENIVTPFKDSDGVLKGGVSYFSGTTQENSLNTGLGNENLPLYIEGDKTSYDFVKVEGSVDLVLFRTLDDRNSKIYLVNVSSEGSKVVGKIVHDYNSNATVDVKNKIVHLSLEGKIATISFDENGFKF